MKFNPKLLRIPNNLKDYFDILTNIEDSPVEEFKKFFEREDIKICMQEGDYKALFVKWKNNKFFYNSPIILTVFLNYIIDDNPYKNWNIEDIKEIFGEDYLKYFSK